MLEEVRRELVQMQMTLDTLKIYLEEIPPLLVRESPAFRAPATHKPMTRKQVARARWLREQEWSLQDISESLGVQIGRVSDAVNGKREGI
jgi:hypothetical protein